MNRKMTIIAMSTALLACMSQSVYRTRNIGPYLKLLKARKQKLEKELATEKSKTKTRILSLKAENGRLAAEIPQLDRQIELNKAIKLKTRENSVIIIESIPVPVKPELFKALKNISDIKGLFTSFGRFVRNFTESGPILLEMQKIITMIDVLTLRITSKAMELLLKKTGLKLKQVLPKPIFTRERILHEKIEEDSLKKSQNKYKIMQNNNEIEYLETKIKNKEKMYNERIKKLDGTIKQVTKEGRYDVDIQIATNQKAKEAVKKELEIAKNEAESENKSLHNKISGLENKITIHKNNARRLEQQINASLEIVEILAKAILAKAKKYKDIEVPLDIGATTLTVVEKGTEFLEYIPGGKIVSFIVGLFTGGGKSAMKATKKTHRTNLHRDLTALRAKLQPILSMKTARSNELSQIFEEEYKVAQLRDQIRKNNVRVNTLVEDLSGIYESMKVPYKLKQKLMEKEQQDIAYIQKGIRTPQTRAINRKIKNIKRKIKALDTEREAFLKAHEIK